MPTALIVEDEPEANRLLSMLVRLRGFTPCSAFSGGEALSMAGVWTPDIVFLDLMLPDITGFDVCSRLRSARATSGVPVVIVSARVEADARARGQAAGASLYVAKPYTPDQIFSALAAAQSPARDPGP